MPPRPQQQESVPSTLSVEQTQTKNYISFDQFETMDTQPAREALEKTRFSWLQNVIILAHNQMTVLPGPSETPVATLTGETITRAFYCFLNGVDYMVCFCVSGAAYGVDLSNGNQTKFANAGTFSTTPDATQWADEALLIGDPTAGYCAWTGTVFVQSGNASPNFDILVGGAGYTSAPTVNITGGSGHGATAVATVEGDAVVLVTLTNAGTGYVATDDLLVVFHGGGPTPAAVTGAEMLETGANYSSAPTVTVTPHPLDATGTGASFTASLVGDAVSSLTLVAGGSGYVATPYISIDGGGGVTNAVFGSITVAGGSITAIAITSNGTNYKSAPMVFIFGDGSGAAATAAIGSGTLSAVTILSGGTGYTSANTKAFAGGGGGALAVPELDNVATAITEVWPITIKPTTLAIFQGRVWLGLGRVLTYSGTTGYSDFDPGNAAGSTTITDSDLVHKITGLRSLNNYLFIFGDNSIKQIGSVTVQSSITNFSIVTLSSDIGTIFPMSVVSYNRLVMFCNTQGIYAVLGASVEKISDPMDGIFRGVDFSQEPVAIVDDLLNLHTYQLLIKYDGTLDPDTEGSQNIILVFTQKRWCVADQGPNVTFIANAPFATITGGNQNVPYGIYGSDLTSIWQDAAANRHVEIQTALTFDSNPFINKRAIRMGIAQSVTTAGALLDISLDSETGSIDYSTLLGFFFNWLNVNNQSFTWLNSLSQPFKFTSVGGFSYATLSVDGSGIYLGATLSGDFNGYNLHGISIEYQTGALFASRNV